MPRIPEAEIDRLKREIDLAALVRSRGIDLKKHGGKDLIGRCPFHDDSDTPNFIVTPDKGLWHCMACGKAGNALQFVQGFDGVSFRHAFELLTEGRAAFVSEGGGEARKRSSARRLDNPLDRSAEDTQLFEQVVTYYHERLLKADDALAYLERRGLRNDEAIERFRLGFADRSLGLRLPDKCRKEGAELRTRLQKLGVFRESGHEHLTGSVVVPVFDEAGRVGELYGRRITRGLRKDTNPHLYLPGPHAGIWNAEALNEPELILCEAPLDALTFWVNGIRNVTFIFGTQGFPRYLFDAVLAHRVKRVRLAYDADKAGNEAAERDSKRLQEHGVDVYRVRFPHGMDANEYALKVQPAAKSLAVAVQSAERLHATPKPQGVGGNGHAPHARACARSSSSLAAELAACPEPVEAANEEIPSPLPDVPAPAEPAGPSLAQRGEYRFLTIGPREYRVGGLEKNNSLEVMKIALRLRHGEDFHLDSFDLLQDVHRRRFIERAADETGLEKDLIKRDLGKLLLALEREQEERLAQATEPDEPGPADMTPEERAEALAFLKSPNLVDRVAETFEACGLVGEEVNRLAAYLACTSRKLARPLAVIIQSNSAAGKSTLMEAVLAFFPEEESVKYSAMTGQSLYYLGETNLKHRILAIVEEEGAEKASYALKLLQSEGELTIASTGKDPHTGRMETQEYHVEGPVMIFLTTTAIEIDEELLNRCLVLTVDETREQTERIHALQRQARTLEGLRLRKRRERLLRLMRNVQRLLEPVDVVNPYADALTFTAERTRTRRDHEKYLTLIDAVALLHQHQRPRESDGQHAERSDFIRVTLDDIALANQLAPELLGRSLDELPPQTRRLLGTIKTIVRERMQAQEIEQRLALFTRRDLRERTGWSEYQVRVHLAKLESLEYVDRRWGHQGKRCAHELLVDADEPENAWHIGLLDVAALRATAKPSGEDGRKRAPSMPTGTTTTSCIEAPTSGHFVESTPRSEKPSTLVACG